MSYTRVFILLLLVLTPGASSSTPLREVGLASSPDSEKAQGEEWPRWRGPRGDGTWFGLEELEAWGPEGLPEVWSRPVGGGYSGVVAVDGRVYTMDRRTEPEEIERILAFDARTGRRLWIHEYAVDYQDLHYGNGPRGAPTVSDGRLYALGAMGHLHCLDAVTGEVIWGHDLVKDFGARVAMWGLAASPLIFEDLVIVHAGIEPGGSLAAFERDTGREVWRSLPDPAGYATPIVVDHEGREQLIVWTPENVRSVEPRTGHLNWTVPYRVTYGVSIATPIFKKGIVLVSGYWEGTKAVRLGGSPREATLLWEENRYLRGLMSQPLAWDGLVFLLDKRFGLTAFELETGRKLWDDANRSTPRDRNPQASLVRLGETDRVLILNAEGELLLARLDREGYHELARTRIIGPTWAHPAYWKTFVFARDDSRLVAVSLSGREEGAPEGRREAPSGR